MRAVRVTRHDGPRAVEVADVPEPVRGADEVLVEVRAAGVNFPDLLLTQNLYQVRPDLPFVLGGEFAGVVVDADPVSGFAPGDRVAGFSTIGAFAERVTAPAWSVFPLPDEVEFTAAAAVPLNYLTMEFALRTRGQLRGGETVLVHGAAGGIGTATIQLATALGARVLPVVSTPDKAEFVKSLGAGEVVFADGFKDTVKDITGGVGVDMVVDPVGGDRFTDSLRCLTPLGRLLVLGFTAGDIPTVRVNRLLLGNIDVRGVGWGEYVKRGEDRARAGWDALLPYLTSGAINPPVTATYPLEEAGAAVALLGDRNVLGKAVLTL